MMLSQDPLLLSTTTDPAPQKLLTSLFALDSSLLQFEDTLLVVVDLELWRKAQGAHWVGMGW